MAIKPIKMHRSWRAPLHGASLALIAVSLFVLPLIASDASSQTLPCDEGSAVNSPVWTSFETEGGPVSLLTFFRFCPCGGRVIPQARAGYRVTSHKLDLTITEGKGVIKGAYEEDQGPPEAGEVKYTLLTEVDLTFDISTGRAEGKWHEVQRYMDTGKKAAERDNIITSLSQVQKCTKAADVAEKKPATFAPIPARPRTPEPRADAVLNGDFSSGRTGWSDASSGYGDGAPKPMLKGPATADGCLSIGASGGFHSVSQNVDVSGLDLELKARMKVERWSSSGGADTGWAAVWVTFIGQGGRTLGTSYHYQSPSALFENTAGLRWERLGGRRSVWTDVKVNLAVAASGLNIDTRGIKRIRVGATVFGTRDGGIHTIACFDDFSLVKAEAQPDSDSDGVPDMRDRCPHTMKGTAVDDSGCPQQSQAEAAAGYVYIGCFGDSGDPSGTQGRDLSGMIFYDPLLTVETCVSECRAAGYPFAGVQEGALCFCGESYGSFGPAKTCNILCGGGTGEVCGGLWSNSVYMVK